MKSNPLGWVKQLLCAYLLGGWRLVKNSFKLVVACLLNGPVVTLVLFVLLALAGGACFAWKGLSHGASGAFGWALDSMFNVSAVLDAVRDLDFGGFHGLRIVNLGRVNFGSLKPWVSAAVQVSLFLTTWLVGGGVLLGVIFDSGRHYLERIRDGRIRYRLGLINHHLILGWDPNAVTFIRERCGGSCQRSVWVSIRRFFMPLPCFVVLSEKTAVEIGLTLNAAFGRNSIFVRRPFRVLVYNGVYDSEHELKQLNIPSAMDVTILGEHNEHAHDSRVLLLLSHLNSRLAGRRRKVRCRARIASHALYCMLTGDRGKYDYPQLDLSYFNFYENWARRLWSGFPPAHGSPYPHLRFSGANGVKNVHLVIVGFGQMGQALALEAARIAQYGDGCKMTITAVDPDLPRLAKDFALICPHQELLKEQGINLQIKDGISCRVESENFKQYLEKLENRTRKEQLTIVLTHSSPDDVIACAQAAWRVVGSDARILVRQDISSSNYDALRHELSGCGTFGDLHVFGFQGGAGVFSDMRERLAERCFAERAERTRETRDVAANHPWIELVDYVRDKFRRTFDALGEILYSVVVEVVDITSADCPFAFSDDEIKVLAQAFHKHWRTDRILAGKGDPAKSTTHSASGKESERDESIDREFVRNLPTLLAGEKLGLRRVDKVDANVF